MELRPFSSCLIHPSAWKWGSTKFARKGFSEVCEGESRETA